MCSEGQTGVKHLCLPEKHIKIYETYKTKTKNSDCVDRNPGLNLGPRSVIIAATS